MLNETEIKRFNSKGYYNQLLKDLDEVMEDVKLQGSVKISVIIPVYNTEKYLRECLDGVVNQTFKDIEIICVDDGSTDKSLAILEDYGRKDNRIIVLSQANKGAGAARNAGLEIAKGEYLAMLDSDDIYAPIMLERMYERSKMLDTDLTVCLTKGFDCQTEYKWDMKAVVAKVEKEVFSYKDILDSCQNFDFFFGWAWDKLFKKSFIDDCGLRFQEISHSNDAFFVHMGMYKAKRITILRESLVVHRLNRKDSLESTHDKNPYSFYEMLTAVKSGLMRFGIFPEVKILFVRWALRYSIWVLDAIKSFQGYEMVFSILKNNIIPENDLMNLPAQYFVEQNFYFEMQKIVKQSLGEYLFDQRNVARVEVRHLRGKCDYLQSQLGLLKTANAKLLAERDYLLNKLGLSESALVKLQANLDGVHGSFSFRLGRMLAWFPRKVRGFFKCLKGNGFFYTFKLFVKKCLRKIGKR